MNFTETGTLIKWQLDDLNIIEPIKAKAGGGSRGGAYLCIPNFEELSPPFSVKHGEYRTTVCDVTLPHRKTLLPSNDNNWGQIAVITDWEEADEQHSNALKVTTTIRALSDQAWVRPGFHPYFSITPNSFLDIGDSRIDIASLPHDSMRAYPAAADDPVKLCTEKFTVTMTCEITPLPQPIALAFGVWSDKKAKYVCIEPVIGKQLGSDGLPTPLVLRKSEELVLAFTIRADRTS